MIPQIDSTVGVKTPSKVPSFELSEPEFAAVTLRFLFLVGWLWLSEVIPDWTVGKDGRADLDFPRRMMPSEFADNFLFQSFCERA
jgi:hypothetical protein